MKSTKTISTPNTNEPKSFLAAINEGSLEGLYLGFTSGGIVTLIALLPIWLIPTNSFFPFTVSFCLISIIANINIIQLLFKHMPNWLQSLPSPLRCLCISVITGSTVGLIGILPMMLMPNTLSFTPFLTGYFLVSLIAMHGGTRLLSWLNLKCLQTQTSV